MSAATCERAVRLLERAVALSPARYSRQHGYDWSWRRRSPDSERDRVVQLAEAVLRGGGRGGEPTGLRAARADATHARLRFGSEPKARAQRARCVSRTRRSCSSRARATRTVSMDAWRALPTSSSSAVGSLPVSRPRCTRSTTHGVRAREAASGPARRVGTRDGIRADACCGGARVVRTSFAGSSPHVPASRCSGPRLLGLLGRFDEARAAFDQAEQTARRAGAGGLRQRDRVRARRDRADRVGRRRGGTAARPRPSSHRESKGCSASCRRTGDSSRGRSSRLGRDDEAEARRRRSRRARCERRHRDAGALAAGAGRVSLAAARRARRGVRSSPREAVARADTTDMLVGAGRRLVQTSPRCSSSAATPTAPTAALERALAEYEQKGVIPAIERTRARLAALRAPA